MKPILSVFLVLLSTLVFSGCTLTQDIGSNRDETNQSKVTWQKFTTPDRTLTFSYPETLSLTNQFVDESGQVAEFRTMEKVQWSDFSTTPTMSDALYVLTVRRVDDPSLTRAESYIVLIDAFSRYITTASSAVDEQERVRMDVDGRYGVRQWVWHKSNPADFSSFTYYLLDGNEVWQLSVWVNLDDPTSAKFKSVRQEIEQIFASVRFAS